MNLGQDMDIFGDIFSNWASGQAGWDKNKDKDLGTGDQPDDINRDKSTDAWTDSVWDKPTGAEIDKTVLDWGEDKEDWADAIWSDDNEKHELKEWETDEVLDDLVKNLEDNIDKVDGGDADAKQVLQNTLSDLQSANIKIKELEDEWKVYQDKYFEKFGENSELNLMKPLIQTVQEDPELFLLVKSYKSSDSDSKVNSLVKMLERETGMDVSSYLTDNWKGATNSSVQGWSGSWMMKARSSDWFTANKVQASNTEDLF